MKNIRITVEGGLIQDIENVPDDVIIEVWDFDIEGEPMEYLSQNKDGEYYRKSIWKK